MKYTYIPNYALATSAGEIRFDKNGLFDTKHQWQEQMLESLGAVKIEAPKKTKAKTITE